MEQLLQYGSILRQVYHWKEAFIDWYDCSSSYKQALTEYAQWLQQNQLIDHPAVQGCLKTMRIGRRKSVTIINCASPTQLWKEK